MGLLKSEEAHSLLAHHQQIFLFFITLLPLLCLPKLETVTSSSISLTGEANIQKGGN